MPANIYARMTARNASPAARDHKGHAAATKTIHKQPALAGKRETQRTWGRDMMFEKQMASLS
jgi:hypothetical protein